MLPLKSALDAIKQVSESSDCVEVVLSGGEPFQDFAYLIAVAEAVHRQGLAFRVVSNGSFGSRDDASELLMHLKRVGLTALAISWDGFHEEFLDPTCVKKVIRICRNLAIPVRVTLVVSRASNIANSLAALGEEAFELAVTQVKCLPVGRAAKKVATSDFLPPADWEVGRACRNDFDTLSIVHDGSVYPCCAVGGFTNGIKLGNVHEQTIEGLLSKRDSDPLWVLLAARGPAALLEFASREELESISVGNQEHDCVACNRLFGSSLGDVLLRRAGERLSARVDALFGKSLAEAGLANSPSP